MRLHLLSLLLPLGDTTGASSQAKDSLHGGGQLLMAWHWWRLWGWGWGFLLLKLVCCLVLTVHGGIWWGRSVYCHVSSIGQGWGTLRGGGRGLIWLCVWGRSRYMLLIWVIYSRKRWGSPCFQLVLRLCCTFGYRRGYSVWTWLDRICFNPRWWGFLILPDTTTAGGRGRAITP